MHEVISKASRKILKAVSATPNYFYSRSTVRMLGKIVNRTWTGHGDSDQHLMTLFSIALGVKAKNILELGVRDGTTSTPLLLAASLTSGRLTSVDLSATSFVPPNKLKKNYEFVQSDAIAFLKKSVEAKKRYDLIYVDDWHTYAHVKQEVALISQIIDENTVVLLHDLMGAGHHPNYWCPTSARWHGTEWEGGGPFKAVCELNTDEFEWATIPVNHGLTILRKRSSVLTE
jgi:predicted O-methyltransferase YrrM